jgi:hypothetical protein
MKRAVQSIDFESTGLKSIVSYKYYRTSLLVLRSRQRLVPEKYFPAGFTLGRPDVGGEVSGVIVHVSR